MATLLLIVDVLRTCTPTNRRRWRQAEETRVTTPLQPPLPQRIPGLALQLNPPPPVDAYHYEGRHHIGKAAGTDTQQMHWARAEFDRLVRVTWATGELRRLSHTAAGCAE